MSSDSFNLYKIKRQAHGVSRRDTGGGSIYNPFSHRYWKDDQRRANTFDAAERGQADPVDTTAGLSPSRTAPGRISIGSRGRETGLSDPEFESQATTVPESPTANGGAFSEIESHGTGSKEPGDGGIRHRGGKDGSTDHASVGSEEEKPKKKQGWLKDIQPKEPFTTRNQLQRTLLNSWINVLLLAAPAGIAIEFLPVNGSIVFAVNFVAIIPLAAMLSFATEEIALRTGEVVGGLINATFGNAVELIVAIIALTQDKVVVVQTSLIGSILSNLLLVLGFCFFCGGINRREQFFNTTVAQTAASLLALAVGSLIVPTVFAHNADIKTEDIARLSHGVAVILLIVYGSYLLFQLKTHSSVFQEESQKVPGKDLFKKKDKNAVAASLAGAGAGAATSIRDKNGDVSALLQGPNTHHDDDEEEDPQLSLTVALLTMLISTVIIALCAEGMVGGIEAIAEEGVSEEFIGLILLPIVGNACEHATAVTVAIKDKMDLAIGVAIGSSMQVALFLIPLLVIIGWGMGNENMGLRFDDFQVVVLFVAVLLVNYLISDGKSHWLEGTLLLCLYLIIAVCSWWYPADNDLNQPGVQ